MCCFTHVIVGIVGIRVVTLRGVGVRLLVVSLGGGCVSAGRRVIGLSRRVGLVGGVVGRGGVGGAVVGSGRVRRHGVVRLGRRVVRSGCRRIIRFGRRRVVGRAARIIGRFGRRIVRRRRRVVGCCCGVVRLGRRRVAGLLITGLLLIAAAGLLIAIRVDTGTQNGHANLS